MGISATILLLSATAAFAAPLIFAAIGELISEKAGVINIELEAMMLAGAFCGVWAALASGSLGVGFIGAALGGVMVAFAHGLLCFVFRAEQVVSGVVLNIFVLGLTTFGIGPIFGSNLGRAAPTCRHWYFHICRACQSSAACCSRTRPQYTPRSFWFPPLGGL